MPAELDSLLEGFDARPGASDSLEGQRLHRTVRARLLDETVPETRIDRFVILERLGVGGMGVVYAAHDPQLDRQVAIKLVRHWQSNDREQDQERLIREARSLAQLSHPHVVAIYDVGLHGDRVFIAMELVKGTTLRRWIGEGARSWPEVMRTLLQAGEGLAAAHAAGLVHRDFKPDNVLVGDDGRVRVLDFGLAQGDGALPSVTALGTIALDSVSLTATGKVAGTPAYMAPEQFGGAAADPRTDQFAFCVACWEALFLARPYPASSTPQLRRMLAEGVIAKPSQPERAPEWLRAVLARGLAPDPDARWPSMRALLDACSPKAPRRKSWVFGAIAMLGAIALTFGAVALWNARQRSACARTADELGAVWNDDKHGTIVAAFGASGLVHAQHTAELVEGVLDGYAQTWRTTQTDSCVAAVDEKIDDAAWQLRRACLDDRRERLGTLVEVLQVPDRDVVNQALPTAYALPLSAACADDLRLAANAELRGGALDPEAVAQLRRRIARAELLAQTRRPGALAFAIAARDDAAVLDDPGILAEAELAIARAQWELGDYQAAAEANERAYFLAAREGGNDIALVAASDLVEVVGGRLARFDDGIMWSRHAEGLLARSGASQPWREAKLAEYVAYVERERGDQAAARAGYERAIGLLTEIAGPDNPAVGRVWSSLAGLLATGDDANAAIGPLDEAERILAPAFGAESMQLALIAGIRGTVEYQLGHYERSAQEFERALAIREALLEPDHPSIAIALTSLANAKMPLGDLPGARSLLVRANELRRRKLGPQHPLLADSLNSLAVVELHIGDWPNARAHASESVQIRRVALPPDHPFTATSLNTLGDIHRQLGELDRAIASYDEVLQMSAPDSPALARQQGIALEGRGMSYLHRGDMAKARADLEAVLLGPVMKDPDPAAHCEVHFGLARALRATNGSSARAHELARTAQQECGESGDRGRLLLDDIAAFLAE
ncbi:MAG TPA: serine/threonine-protein kinase [Nannocystaceae bacterium]|nr:serine/threonine-protein kinase [Nannocystaceae bacterium]